MTNSKVMNNLFDISVKLDKVEEGQHVHAGILQIIPNEHIGVEQIQGELRQKVKGKMAGQNELVDNFTVSTQYQQLPPNETYEFPFKIIQPSKAGTYKGTNVHIFYELEFAVELEKDSYKRLDKSLVKSIKSLVTRSTDYKYSKPITLRKASNYDIPKGQGLLELGEKDTFVMVFFSGLFVMLWFILFGLLRLNTMESWLEVMIIGVVVSAVIGYLSQVAFFRIVLGIFDVDIVKKDGENFTSIIHSTGNWRYVQAAKTYYKVIEEVVDDRGTTSYTYAEKIYVSDNMEMLLQNSQEEIVHPLPRPNSVPPVVSIHNVSVKWIIVLDLTTIMNLNLKYERVIYESM